MPNTAVAGLGLDGAALLCFAGYLLVVIGIGVYATRFSSSGLGEFFVGGRRMSRFVVALSAVVSGRSAWLLLGLTGMAYSRGASAVWSVVGYIVAELFLFLFYARRLRRFSEHHDCITLPDFYASRFADRGGLLRSVLVPIILIFMVSYVAAQFVAGGKAFAAGFSLSPTTGILITAAIVLIYTVLGGFLAVSLTDVIQGLFMLGALVLLPAVALIGRGGLAAVLAELEAFDATLIDPLALGFGVFIGFLGVGLGSPGSPHILVRYMSIRNPEQLRYSAVLGTVWNVVMAWGALLTGITGRAYFPRPEMLPGGDPESLYPALAQLLLPPWLFGLVIASVFAAIMSTADSQLLVAASSLVRDLYQRVIRQGETLSPRALVGYSRLVVVGLVLVAVVLGLYADQMVFWLVLFAWAGLGAALGPTSILALYWRRTTAAGVVAGLLTGTAVTILWKSSERLSTSLYEIIPAFVAALAVTVLVSLCTRPPEDVEDSFALLEDGTGDTTRR